MDIIEVLLSLGSVTVDSMISTSERYSKDKRFTPEGREYYKELHDGLTMASKNLKEYKQKRETSAFEKLRSNAIQDSKLSGKQNNTDIFRVHALIEAYFSVYRGKYPFYFFDQESSAVHEKILQYVTFPYGAGKKEYQLTPIIAISTLKNGDTSNAFSMDTVVFCEEGIAFDFKGGYFNVMPYANVKMVCKKAKRSFLINKCDVFLVDSTGDFSTSYVLESTYPPGADLYKCSENDRNLIAHSIYDFIRCFNPNCKYVEKK